MLSGVAEDARLQREEIFGPCRDRRPRRRRGRRRSAPRTTASFALGAQRLDARSAKGARASRAGCEAGSVWHERPCLLVRRGAGCIVGRREEARATDGRTRSTGCTSSSHVKYADRDSGRVGVPWWFPYDRSRCRRASAGALGALYGSGAAARGGSAWRNRRSARALCSGGTAKSDLSHVDESGARADGRRRRQADCSAAARWRARSCAWRRRRRRGCVTLPKGDALTTAQLAGIMAAKRTADLIPLCHPLALSHVEVELVVGEGRVEITAAAETTAQTGVEMEALTAASVAALTVYDMAKAIDKADDVRASSWSRRRSRERGGAHRLGPACRAARRRTPAAICSSELLRADGYDGRAAASCRTRPTRSPWRSRSSPRTPRSC